MLVLAVNVIFSMFTEDRPGITTIGQVFVQSLSLMLFLWLALIGKNIWPVFVSAIFLLRVTFLTLNFSGVKVSVFYLDMLRSAVWTFIPVAIIGGGIWARSKKAMWWTKR